MANNNITSNQLISCLLSAVAALCLMNTAPIFYKNFGQNTWLIMILISVLTFMLLLLVNKTAESCSYLAPGDVLNKLLGKYGGIIANALLIAYVLLFTALTLRIFLYVVSVYYLPKTPLIITGTLLMLPCLYTAYGGTRIFGHLSIFLYILLAAFLSIFLLTKNNFILTNLFPLLEGNLIENITYIPYVFITSSAILGCFFLFPAIVNPQKIKRSLLIFSIISLLLMLFVYFVGRTYFGRALTELLLPFYNLTTKYNFRVLERLDIIFLLIFVPIMGLFNTFFFTLLHNAQKKLFKKTNEKHPTIILLIWGILIVLLAIFPTIPNRLWQVLYLGNLANLALVFLLIIAYWSYFLKRRWQR